MSLGRRSPLASRGSAALLCALLALVVHLNALNNQFAYDDVHILTENVAIHDARNLPGLLAKPYWPGDFSKELGLWRPGTTLTLGVQWAFFQGQGAPYHLVNILAHAVATALVVLLIAALSTVPVGFVSGLVFAVHPVHVEAVSNIVGIAEVQAAVFFLAACLVHVRAGPPLEEGGSYGIGRVLAVTTLYLGAFLTKESAVTLPGVIFLLDATRAQIGLGDLKAYARRRALLYGVMAAGAGVVLALRFAVLGSLAHPLGPLGADLLQQGVPRIWTVAGIWTHYVRLMVFPLDLASDYSPNVLPIELGWRPLNIAGLVLALAFLIGAWIAFRARELGRGWGSGRLVGFGVMWFVITISPISNVFFLAGVLLAERTLYLPSVGAVAVAGWLLVRLVERRRALGVSLVGAVVVLMGVRSWTRTPTWEHTGTVFETMLQDTPQSGRSQWVLGDLFYLQGRVPESLHAYRAAIGILGGHHQLMTEIGKKLIGAKKYRAADFILLHAWREEPAWGVAPGYLAVNHFQQEDWVEAERYARASLEIDGDEPLISHILASALAAQGRFAEAIPWRENSIRNGEGANWEQWMTLARLRMSVGDSLGAGMARDSAVAKATTPEERRGLEGEVEPYAPVEPQGVGQDPEVPVN